LRLLVIIASVAFVSARAVLRRELGACCCHFIAAYSWANTSQLTRRSARSIDVGRPVSMRNASPRRVARSSSERNASAKA
jgi:hypothetical protein